MTLSKRDIKLLLCLLGIAVFLALYLGVYNRYVEKSEKIRTEIEALKPELRQLQEYDSAKAAYTRDIEDARAVMNGLSPRYPNDVRAEDKIMFVADLEREVGLRVSAASFTDPLLLLDFPGVAEEDGGAYSIVPLSAYSSGISLSCTMTYPQLKKALTYIYGLGPMHSVGSVSVSFDGATGELYGSMNIDKYYITGADGAYYPTRVPSCPLGTDNIFGSITAASAETPPLPQP